MPPTRTGPDPRSVVTPDAFHVSEELLGLRLASPRRRLAAVWIDLMCIAFLTAVTRSFALLLGVIASMLIIRAGLKRTPVRGSVFGRAMRVSVVLLGIVIGLSTAVLWAVVDDDEVRMDLTLADDARAGDEADDAPASDASPGQVPIELREEQVVRDEIALYSLEEALDAYAALLRTGRDNEMDRARLEAFHTRLASELAADTLAGMAERIEELEDVAARRERQLRRARDDLDAAESAGLLARVMGLLDDLGFGFGWAALYTTVLLTVWRGRTVGKRVLGLRVVRLDGEPITWWVAFERAGGYAAGFATGLLGFAQVYWDANRQAIHDRIVGTVVIHEGSGPTPTMESAA